MKIEIPYIRQITAGEITEIKTKTEKIFYQLKIVAKSEDEVVTILLNSMDKSVLTLKPNKKNKTKDEK